MRWVLSILVCAAASSANAQSTCNGSFPSADALLICLMKEQNGLIARQNYILEQNGETLRYIARSIEDLKKVVPPK